MSRVGRVKGTLWVGDAEDPLNGDPQFTALVIAELLRDATSCSA